MRLSLAAPFGALLAAASLTAPSLTANAATLTTAPDGTTPDGKPVSLTTMTAADGVTVKFMSYGGIITQILAPDRYGRVADVVLGFPTLSDYETKSAAGGLYFGALVGRYANRIAKGRFTLDGTPYQLAINNPPNALHGGLKGFDKRVWHVQPGATSGRVVSATLRLTSPDGDQGYPGEMKVVVVYGLADDGSLTIHYRATTNKDTVLNLTNHSYFNLAGIGARDGVYNQVMTINADSYTPTDATAIPLGRNVPVAGTPFDFRQPAAIGAHIRDDDTQLIQAHGYDHNWVINPGTGRGPTFAARLFDPNSGRELTVLTTQPGVQVYTGNFLKGEYAGNGGIYRQTDGVTFETQHFPDSPNQPGFPTTELKPGQIFDQTTIFKFGVRK
ncbi:aldose epimerase family protein [Lichenicoccus sp.]|uniref:aldose epimerase family protein n=1 Tax=Lichenicoccus sp. TaxID=2781899 RepID=UPI003D14FEC6